MSTEAFYRQVSSGITKYLYQEISLVLGRHYLVERVTSGPRVLTLHVRINPRYASRIMAMASAMSMAAGLDGTTTIRVQRGRRGALSLEIPKPKTLWFNLGVDYFPLQRGLVANVGLDTAHEPATVNFANPLTPHGLIAGATGSGKTNTARVLVHYLARQNEPGEVGFLLLDVGKQGKAWQGFGHLPHLLHPPIDSEDVALRALTWLCAERARRIERRQVKPEIFTVIDEAQDLLEKEPFVKAVTDPVTKGRESGIHCLLLTQKPTVEQLGDTVIKGNLLLRLIGKVDSGIAASTATGQKQSGAELLTSAGDMLRIGPEGIARFTAFLLTDKDLARLPKAETVRHLDLDPYEDVDHVVEEPASRQAEPLELAPVIYALLNRGVSQRAVYDQFHIGFPKIKRVLALAQALRAELVATTTKAPIAPSNSFYVERVLVPGQSP